MAVNKQFSGNLVDINLQEITEARYRGYHTPTGSWSDWYYTKGIAQYNINLGDSSWLTQDGIFNLDDEILLVFETLETEPENRIFSSFKLKLSTDDLYVFDVQLRATQPPVIVNNWYLKSELEGTNTFLLESIGEYINIGRVNNPVTAVVEPNTYYSWTYNDILLEHIETYCGYNIFKEYIGIETILYRWESEYLTENIYLYNDPSDYSLGYDEVVVTAVNMVGLSVSDSKKIQIRYNIPESSLTWTPDAPSILDTLLITATNKDVDNVRKKIEYLKDDIVVQIDNSLNYSWEQNIGTTYVPEFKLSTLIYWNDGFYDLIERKDYVVGMTNLPFTFDIEITNNDNIYEFIIHDINDPDGNINEISYSISLEYMLPYNSVFTNIYTSDFNTKINYEYVFELPGTYKITVIGKDKYGDTTINSKIFSIDSLVEECSINGILTLIPETTIFTSIPLSNKKISTYLNDKLIPELNKYGTELNISDVISYVTTYDNINKKYLTYKPGYSRSNGLDDFDLINIDNSLRGIIIVTKNYTNLTSGNLITIDWKEILS